MFRKWNLFLACCLFSICFGNVPALAQEITPNNDEAMVESKFLKVSSETADFSKVEEKVKELAGKYSVSKVLLVVDIDNTLLAMNQDLGSDQWFSWQESLLKGSTNSPDLVAKDFNGLLDVQGQLFALSSMHPPEPKLPQMIKGIQGLGVRAIVLTSRGPNFRNSTMRELAANGYDFSKSSFSIREKRGPFRPIDATNFRKYGVPLKEATELIRKSRDASFSRGVFMTAGQHKGWMLRLLLARWSKKNDIRAIVFVDDHPKHCQRMQDAFKAVDVDLFTFRYSQEDGNVAKFQQSNKRHVVRKWNQLSQQIQDVFVK